MSKDWGRAARWTSQCFDSFPTAQCSHGSRLSLADILLRLIYVCVSPAFSFLLYDLLPFSASSRRHFSCLSIPQIPFFIPPLFASSLWSFLKAELEKRTNSCYAVFLPEHPDLLLRFWNAKVGEISNIRCHRLPADILFCLYSETTQCAKFSLFVDSLNRGHMQWSSSFIQSVAFWV